MSLKLHIVNREIARIEFRSSQLPSRREESPRSNRAEEPRAAGASALRGIRPAIEAASGRVAGRCAVRRRSRASASDVLGAGDQRNGRLSRWDRGPRGDPDHLELRRIEDMAFDRALIHGPQHRLAVLLREGRRKQDLQPDARDALTGLVPPGCELESETVRVEMALPAELEGVEAGAGTDRR